MSRLLLSLLLLSAALLGADPAGACGPDFPPTLLDARQATLSELPDEPFFVDAAHLLDGLLPPDPGLVGHNGEPEGARLRGGEKERELYEQGAKAFVAWNHDRFTQTCPPAEQAFRAVLALPAEQRRQRSTWAAFMLGRLGHPEMWAETRRLAAAGFVDELGLAATSLGAEARIALDGEVGGPRPALVDAITLYARQARAGDNAGAVSLLFVLRSILDDDEPGDAARLRQLQVSPVGQRLLATYAFARADERPEKVKEVIAVLVKQPEVQWPDRLAAALYRQGRFDDAARLVARAPQTPLGLWVRAKLALHDGDLDAARPLLAAASQAFPPVGKTRDLNEYDEEGEPWWHPRAPTPRGRVLGEEAILALARREYIAALDKLLQAQAWWQDAAFVAERVLSSDELIAYVDQHAPVALPVQERWSFGQPNSQNNSLRHLLARRLVREGRPTDALRYLDDPRLREQLGLYLDLLKQVADADVDDELAKAFALYQAAGITRTWGMELRGTELGPDWFIFGGSYDGSLSWDDDGNELHLDPVPVPSTLVDVNEAQRVRAAGPTPDERYHYRRVAAGLAEDAASHVPPKSQAFAALLCQASRFAKRNPDEVKRLWQLYVQHGAPVDFNSAFGSFEQECPAPDFAALHARRQTQQQPWFIAASALLGLTAGLVWLRRRGQKATAFHAPP